MILADKIIEERKKNGWSQEELAARLGVSRQAVSKWESAGSIPDLQRVIQLAELFSVSTDYLLKDELEPDHTSIPAEEHTESEPPVRRVSMEEANEFLEIRRKAAPAISNAVAMCILSPVVLIFLETRAEAHLGRLSEAMASCIGLVVLFVLIAGAVFIFITSGLRLGKTEYLEKEAFETEYGITGMVKEKKTAFEPVFTRCIALGVVLIILAVVPLIVAGSMNAPEYVEGALASVMLLLIAIAVKMIVQAAMMKAGYDTLLQEGDYSRREKRANKKLGPFAGIYWCTITAIYLAWSFITMSWERTWIIWPVAGVLYAAISGIARIMMGLNE